LRLLFSGFSRFYPSRELFFTRSAPFSSPRHPPERETTRHCARHKTTLETHLQGAVAGPSFVVRVDVFAFRHGHHQRGTRLGRGWRRVTVEDARKKPISPFGFPRKRGRTDSDTARARTRGARTRTGTHTHTHTHARTHARARAHTHTRRRHRMPLPWHAIELRAPFSAIFARLEMHSDCSRRVYSGGCQRGRRLPCTGERKSSIWRRWEDGCPSARVSTAPRLTWRAGAAECT
jgi:hypothetical protein